MGLSLIALIAFSLLFTGCLTQTTVNITNGTNCSAINALVTLGPVDAIRSAPQTNRALLAGQLLGMTTTSTVCPVTASITAYWHVCGKSGNVKVYLSGVEVAQIISWGAAALAMVAPYEASSASFATLGLSPVLDDNSRKLLFIISIERMTVNGDMANGDEMIMDVTVTQALSYVLMFDLNNKNGKKLESEGGKWDRREVLKFRLWLPHTSTVAGYGDGSGQDTGSSSGLYGLFALIVLPILAIAALVAYCCYQYMHSARAMDSYVPQAAGQEFTPQPYVPPQNAARPSPYYTPQPSYITPRSSYVPTHAV